MATVLLDVDVRGSGGVDPRGVVSVCRYGFWRSRACCSCGWDGDHRRLIAAAEQDAWVHSMREHCTVSSPLVLG